MRPCHRQVTDKQQAAEDLMAPHPRLIRRTLAVVTAFAVAQCLNAALADDTKTPRTAAKQPANQASQSSEKERREGAVIWAAHFVIRVRNEDLAGCNVLIDWDALFEKATAYPNLTPTEAKQRREFIVGGISSTKQVFCKQLIETVRKGGSYKFLRYREVDGQRRALFRDLDWDGRLNYHDFVLASGDDAGIVRLRAVDCYVFYSGYSLTDALRLAFLPTTRTWNKKGFAQLAAEERAFLTHFTEFTSLEDAFHEKQDRRVLDVYQRMPDSLKKRKDVLAMRLQAAQRISNDETLRAIADFRKYYPDDVSADLIARVAFLSRKSYDQVLVGLDRIEKAVGGDAYLKALRANILRFQGKTEAAAKMAEAAMAEEPTLEQAYFVPLMLSLNKHDFAKTAEVLSAVETNCHLKLEDLTNFPEYQEFVKSPEYKAWLKSHNGGGSGN
jgi:hypothetical protein